MNSNFKKASTPVTEPYLYKHLQKQQQEILLIAHFQVQICKEKDYITLQDLVKQCPPLDIHTGFTYWILANYFASSCFLLKEQDKAIGYILAIYTFQEYYIWQIGILPAYQKKGLSYYLIDASIKRAKELHFKKIQVSIAKENENSYNAFLSYANENGYCLTPIRNIEVLNKNSNVTEHEILYEFK